MPGVEKLHLEEAFEDSPQVRSLVSVFEKDCSMVKDYMLGMTRCCGRILNSQREMSSAIQELSAHLRAFEQFRFPLSGDNCILIETLNQFASYIDEVSSLHQIFVSQLGDQMMYPLNKFLQADMEEISTMGEMYKLSTIDLDESLAKYMRLSKKKENEKVRQECVEDVFTMKKKFHQTTMHYFAALNSLQYKKKTVILEPLEGLLQTERSFALLGKETLCKEGCGEFLANVNASTQGVRAELTDETKKMVELMDAIEQNSSALYQVESPAEGPYMIQCDSSLTQKAGYLFMRSTLLLQVTGMAALFKQGLLNTKWERCYFFIQAGNLMCQHRDEFAGSLVMDLNDKGVMAEPVECDDRYNVFQVVCTATKKSVILQTENPQERDEWIATVNNVARQGDYVKGDPVSKDQRSLSSPTVGVTVPKPVSKRLGAASTESPPPCPPSTPQPLGIVFTAPIQFDIIDQVDKDAYSKGAAGESRRVNPFDKAPGLLSQNSSCDSFLQTYVVRFLGSMEVKTDRGEEVIHDTMRQIRATRAIHNMFKTNECHLVINDLALSLVDPSVNTVKVRFPLEDISYWASHQDDKRLMGFILRKRSEGSTTTFECFVFESDSPADDICHALGTATKLAYQALMTKQKLEEEKKKETALLLANISNLEDAVDSAGSADKDQVHIVGLTEDQVKELERHSKLLIQSPTKDPHDS